MKYFFFAYSLEEGELPVPGRDRTPPLAQGMAATLYY
jgi:hypothetical protein